MTSLKTIFNKPIDRPIEGVIKADDDASLRLEIEEYVLTNEVEKRLESFLDAYNNYEGANGVWISGFFGSGKSHLLKMLALLLENKEIDGAAALGLFLPKCQHNEILCGDLKRAVSIPSKSILFNIDQKADVISKTQIDALLAVFVKVFDETCGYYGKQGHIAQFERDLDSRELYEPFKSAFESIAGKSWQKGREQALLEAQHIVAAYTQITGADESSSEGILDKYRNEYRVSIEDFANQVNDYIDQQGKNFRLNFFVDEVGQYIADSVKLMTNLQTLAESLATKSRGRAWIIVTAQEDMGSVVGEMTQQQGNDFSKIQARFANRMKLTSADVAEVIQKRLLMKTEVGIAQLSDIYHDQSNNLKTLFDFADGSQTYRNFQDKEHFIHCYPFIPYQFALFQSAIQSLSVHEAFEGMHSSVGERSMLGVFQQVAVHIGEHKLGQLATFDLMFAGIRTALKSNIQYSIIQAEKHLDSPFALRLLQALFLVKYVKEFKPTIRNLCVLMLEDFDQDLPALRKQVEEALNLLEQQTYVQRNGELYEFLTDDEKDIEKEIKNIDVETSDVSQELDKLVFDYVIKDRKIRYNASSGNQGQDYVFTRKLDDRLYGREHELAINVITPFHEHANNEQMLRTSSTYNADELFVVMPVSDRLLRDLLLYKRTDKYIRQNMNNAQQDAVRRILNDKAIQNQERLADLKQSLTELLGKARLWIGGSDIEISSNDAQTRIIRAFHELIARVYPNLRMLRDINYSEDMIKTILNDRNNTLFGTDSTVLAESEQELLAFVQSNNKEGVRTTLKSVLEKFGRKPYGWYYAAVLCLLASLCARGKLEMRANSESLEDDELDKALRNTHGHGNVILQPQIEFTASQVRALKTFYEDFFDAPPKANEAKALGHESALAFQALLQDLQLLLAQLTSYPFLIALEPVTQVISEYQKKPYSWYLADLPAQEDRLLKMKESIIDPIRKFMSGTQKAIYEDARHYMQEHAANFSDIQGDEVERIQATLADPDCFNGKGMQEVKGQLENLRRNITVKIKEEQSRASKRMAQLKDSLFGMPDFKSLNTEQQVQISTSIDSFAQEVTKQQLIPVIRDSLRRFEETHYQQLLSQVSAWVQANKVSDEPQTPGPTDHPPKKPQKQVEYVAARAVSVPFDKAWLADEQDVDDYLKATREAYIGEIRKGKRIQV